MRHMRMRQPENQMTPLKRRRRRHRTQIVAIKRTRPDISNGNSNKNRIRVLRIVQSRPEAFLKSRAALVKRGRVKHKVGVSYKKDLPRKASTMADTPFMALRKMSGKAAKHG